MQFHFNYKHIKIKKKENNNAASRCKASKNLTEMWEAPSYFTSTTLTHMSLSG